MCREHGQQLSELAAQTSDFGFWGTVKETGVDDEGLSEFYHSYYKFPLYRDVGLETYAAFGNKSVMSSVSTWNPFKIYRGYKEMKQRLEKKKIEGNLKGEGVTKGGVFVLNTDGEVVYALEEETGSPLEMEEIEAAMESLRKSSAKKVAPEL